MSSPYQLPAFPPQHPNSWGDEPKYPPQHSFEHAMSHPALPPAPAPTAVDLNQMRSALDEAVHAALKQFHAFVDAVMASQPSQQAAAQTVQSQDLGHASANSGNSLKTMDGDTVARLNSVLATAFSQPAPTQAPSIPVLPTVPEYAPAPPMVAAHSPTLPPPIAPAPTLPQPIFHAVEPTPAPALTTSLPPIPAMPPIQAAPTMPQPVAAPAPSPFTVVSGPTRVPEPPAASYAPPPVMTAPAPMQAAPPPAAPPQADPYPPTPFYTPAHLPPPPQAPQQQQMQHTMPTLPPVAPPAPAPAPQPPSASPFSPFQGMEPAPPRPLMDKVEPSMPMPQPPPSYFHNSAAPQMLPSVPAAVQHVQSAAQALTHVPSPFSIASQVAPSVAKASPVMDPPAVAFAPPPGQDLNRFVANHGQETAAVLPMPPRLESPYHMAIEHQAPPSPSPAGPFADYTRPQPRL